jgi:hypothetical protein
MFNAYEYLSSISPDIPEILKVYKVSGLSSLEEMLSDIRNNPQCCLCVRDAGDGFLDLKTRRLDSAYHTFYVMVKAETNNHDSRLQAKRSAMKTCIKLMDRAKKDSNDFGDPVYGLDFSKIDYSEIGPLGSNYYGYSFGYSIDHEL